ncbi:nucleotidyl transferase [Paenibacillus selenitireducens]|uniref:Glucose-1-phosphate thymidylyltransferase n=1 Tax=Paenibacillus selenitireducens TaxID=1324314 RepID=A0A1T2XCA1_9BACL|nr:sugar phosphate nucleotidyltransferase [Paenibacillus selenitireducens]OPA77402.1 nucleotidyl transferase [Paenibacillus selenitireducens]
MKGLIVCAGRGTRLQPFSYLTSKVLLPVANKPLIFYSLEKLISLGITEIGIVIQPAQKMMFKEHVGNGVNWGVRITYLFQENPLGIADAVKQSESFIGSDSFILLLGDNLISQSLAELKDSILVGHYDGALLLGKVENPQEYGIAEIEEQRIIGLEEKPLQPKSNLAIVGAYAFTAQIFKAVHAISPSRRGEYEITDAIQYLIQHGYSISYDIATHPHTDVGTPGRWLEANRWMLQTMPAEKTTTTYDSYVGSIIQSPVLIDPSSKLLNCVIGPYVVIGPRVTLENCKIEDSIILEGVNLRDCTLKGSIISIHHAVPPI